MSVLKFRKLEVEAEVCGQVRVVGWDLEAQVFVIRGVASFPEVVEVFAKLATGGVTSFSGDALQDMAAAVTEEREQSEVDQAVQKLRQDVASGKVPPATTPVSTRPLDKPIDQAIADLKRHEPRPGDPEHRETKVAEDPKAPGQETPKASGEATTSDGELASFANMTKLGQVVKEAQGRGYGTYPELLAYLTKLQDIGDVCPPVDALGKQLEERLKVYCVGKGIPGA